MHSEELVTPKFSLVAMSGGASSRKGYGNGKGKLGRNGAPIIWKRPLGPASFPEAVFEFP